MTAIGQVQIDLKQVTRRVYELSSAVEALAAKVAALESRPAETVKRGPGRPKKAEVS